MKNASQKQDQRPDWGEEAPSSSPGEQTRPPLPDLRRTPIEAPMEEGSPFFESLPIGDLPKPGKRELTTSWPRLWAYC